MNTCCSYNFKKTLNEQIIQNQDLLRLRLSPEEKKYYTDLYYNTAINGKVNCYRFRPLLGMLGTQIAQEFSDRIFYAFSSPQIRIYNPNSFSSSSISSPIFISSSRSSAMISSVGGYSTGLYSVCLYLLMDRS